MNLAIFGWLAVTLTTVQFIPQVIKAYKTKKSRDISSITYYIVLIAATAWLIHGINISDPFIIVANIGALICAIAIIVIKKSHS